MRPKIFLTGGTGYIGGSVLDTIVKKHPDYQISVLLRSVPERFASEYPTVRVVQGDYDSHDLLSREASEADIVIHNGDSDHVPSIKSLIAGLVKDTKPGASKFLIHLSGTGIVADFHDPEYLGRENPKLWSDVDDLDAITSLPNRALHRPVDKIIQDAARAHADKLKTAIVCPSSIYGRGTGLGRTETVYFKTFLNEMKGRGNIPFYVKEGGNSQGWVELNDLMSAYLKLTEAAVAGGKGADWGVEGYYFIVSQIHSQRAIAEATTKVLRARGLTTAEAPQELPLETIKPMIARPGREPLGTYFFASNSRTRADRAKAVLGWKPSSSSLLDAVDDEIERALK